MAERPPHSVSSIVKKLPCEARFFFDLERGLARAGPAFLLFFFLAW